MKKKFLSIVSFLAVYFLFLVRLSAVDLIVQDKDWTYYPPGQKMTFSSIYIYNGGVLSITDGVEITCNDIHIDAGGTLEIISQNSQAVLTMNGSPSLMSVCYGKFIVKGTQSIKSLVRFKAGNPNKYCRITLLGSTDNIKDTAKQKLTLSNGEFRNVLLDVTNYKPTGSIEYCNFYGDRTGIVSDIILPLVKYSNSSLSNNISVNVKNCNFKDLAGIITDLSHLRSTEYWSYTFGGIEAHKINLCSLSTNTFNYLNHGLSAFSCVKVDVNQNNTFTDMYHGVLDHESLVYICNNAFTDNCYGVKYMGSHPWNAYRNTFTGCGMGMQNFQGGCQMLRGNIFTNNDNYGIYGWALESPPLNKGEFMLAPIPDVLHSCGETLIFGKNSFTSNTSLSRYFDNGYSKSDVFLKKSTAYTKKGLNQFSPGNWHVDGNLGTIYAPIQVEYNKWRNTGIRIRPGIPYVDSPFNNTYTADDAVCWNACTGGIGIGPDDPPRGMVCTPTEYNDGRWAELDPASPALVSHFDFARSFMQDMNNPLDCRYTKACDALQCAKQIEGQIPQLMQLKSDYDVIISRGAADTLTPAIMILKAYVHEILSEPDSAATCYNNVLIHYPATGDIASANLGLARINYIFTTDHNSTAYDSAAWVYYNMVAGYTMPPPNDSMPRINSNEENRKDNAGEGIYMNIYYPGSTMQDMEIEYYVNEPGMVNISVFDLLGNKVSSLVNQREEKGIHIVRFNEVLPQGIYYCNMTCGNQSVTRKLFVTK